MADEYNRMPLQYQSERPLTQQDIEDRKAAAFTDRNGALLRALAMGMIGVPAGLVGTVGGMLAGGPAGAIAGAGGGLAGGGIIGNNAYENVRNDSLMRGQMPPMPNYYAQPPLADQMPLVPEYLQGQPSIPPSHAAIVRALRGQ